MILENLQQICQQWQGTLKLQDWDVLVKVVPDREMDNAIGQIHWDLDEKVADIKLVNPEEYPSRALRPYNMEETLVHELLHLHFAPFNINSGAKGLAQEQAINAIARALVSLKNANPNLPTQGDTLNTSPAT